MDNTSTIIAPPSPLPQPDALQPGPAPSLSFSALDGMSLEELRKQFTAEQYEKAKNIVTMFCSAGGGSSLRAVANNAQHLERSQSEQPAPATNAHATKPAPAGKPSKRDRVAVLRDVPEVRPSSAPLPAIDASDRPRISLDAAAETHSQKERERRKEKKRRLVMQENAPASQNTHHTLFPPSHSYPTGPSIKIEPPSSYNLFPPPPPHPPLKRYASDMAVYGRQPSAMDRFMEEKERRDAVMRSTSTSNLTLKIEPSDDAWKGFDDDENSPYTEPRSPSPPLTHLEHAFAFQYPGSSLYPDSAAPPTNTVTPHKKSIPATSSPYHPDHILAAPFPLPDGPRSASKPNSSYAALIGQAINAAPTKRASLSQIYNWICAAYPFYHRKDAGWQNSIRHNLSLNDCFVKIKRDEGQKGKGCWWGIRTGDEECFADGGFRRKGSAPRPAPAPKRERVYPAKEVQPQPTHYKKRKAAAQYTESESESEESMRPTPAKRHATGRRHAQERVVFAVPPPVGTLTQPFDSCAVTPVRASLRPIAEITYPMPGLTPSVSSPLNSSPPNPQGLMPAYQDGPATSKSAGGLQPSVELLRYPPHQYHSSQNQDQDPVTSSPYSFFAKNKLRSSSRDLGLTAALPPISFPKPSMPSSPTRPRTALSKPFDFASPRPSTQPEESALRTPTQPSTPRASRSFQTPGSAYGGLRYPPSTPLQMHSPGHSLFGTPQRTPLGRVVTNRWDMSDPALQANEELNTFIASGTKLGLFDSPQRNPGLWDSPGPASGWY